MPICFVIQPFDKGKYDKRYNDIYLPAIQEAGLEAYRVDNDPSVTVPIDAIESGIQKASICLADITEDNPNVWYELGYAFATGCPIVMVSSEERTGKKYPFDIQHRAIISYSPASLSDFQNLKKQISNRLQALMKTDVVLRKIAESDPIAHIGGLSRAEVILLAVIAGNVLTPNQSIGAYGLKRDAEAAGVTKMAFIIALKRLLNKGFILLDFERDENGYDYDSVRINDSGWEWIDKNESNFVLIRPESSLPEPELPKDDDDLPF
jgi:hypothetical protein